MTENQTPWKCSAGILVFFNDLPTHSNRVINLVKQNAIVGHLFISMIRDLDMLKSDCIYDVLNFQHGANDFSMMLDVDPGFLQRWLPGLSLKMTPAETCFSWI